MLKRIREWVSRLPPQELDLPLIVLDGLAYTPRMVLAEVERGTTLGQRLQQLVEMRSFGTTMSEAYSLAKLRLKQILSRYPPDKPIVAALGVEGPIVYTPRELIEEIERGTPRGTQWIEGEINRMRYLMSLVR